MAVQGLDRVLRKIKLIPQRMLDAVRDQMEKEATAVVAEMRRFAPKDTGALAASINWTWGDAPAGALKLGVVKAGKKAGTGFAKMTITIYAGGTAATKRTQSRASGDRKRDHHRRGAFETDVAILQEFGTLEMPANPFFFPVFRVMKRGVASRITRAGSKAFKNG